MANRSGWKRGGVPIFPILLIAAGVLLLLQTTGVVSWDAWGRVWRLWPVLIIAVGINIIFGRRVQWLAGILVAGVGVVALVVGLLFVPAQSTVSVSSVQEALEGAETVDVSISFGGGELTLGSLPVGSNSLVEGDFRGHGAEVSTVRIGNKTDLNIDMKREGISFLTNLGENNWNLSLSRSPGMTLDINGGAADASLDLTDLKISDIKVDVGASDVEITMPARAGHVTGDIDTGAADIEIVIPEGVAARIHADTGVSSLQIDESRFPKVGDKYVSPDFDDATNRVDIEIDAGASSITVR